MVELTLDSRIVPLEFLWNDLNESKTPPLPARIIVEEEDGVRVVEVAREPRAGSVVSICGVEGWGIEPSDSPLQNGGLIWWVDGLQSHISARIPLNQILSIANSVC